MTNEYTVVQGCTVTFLSNHIQGAIYATGDGTGTIYGKYYVISGDGTGTI